MGYEWPAAGLVGMDGATTIFHYHGWGPFALDCYAQVPFPGHFCVALFYTPSVSFYLSLDSVILHYPVTNKKKRREYDLENPIHMKS
jgi:hypothetical protein